MTEFRIIDLRTGIIEPEVTVKSISPEKAAEEALGVQVVRSGKPKHLVCRIYWTTNGTTNMIRFYSQTAHPHS
ncbi:hypothetical protein [Devosia salina]|uniref:DUF4258 domain-containing protein n=1 Tax=Devosia salina TaxID=2860336 RepID=A0ABX8WJ11_9HYPH|nr:hypothetical protein [Devosia salina]QYO78878.1 hypothetical protein K1X15_10230 [Devosia salina]